MGSWKCWQTCSAAAVSPKLRAKGARRPRMVGHAMQNHSGRAPALAPATMMAASAAGPAEAKRLLRAATVACTIPT